jgi:hypothetical protein
MEAVMIDSRTREEIFRTEEKVKDCRKRLRVYDLGLGDTPFKAMLANDVRIAEAEWTRALTAAMGFAARHICAREFDQHIEFPFFWHDYADDEPDADVNIGRMVRKQYLDDADNRKVIHSNGDWRFDRELDLMTFEQAVLVLCHG